MGPKRHPECQPGWQCLKCKYDNCLAGSTSPTPSEREMLDAADVGIKKRSTEAATFVEHREKYHYYIIPLLRRKRHIPKYRRASPVQYDWMPLPMLEAMLRRVFGIRLRPVIAPLSERGRFRSLITKDMGMYGNYGRKREYGEN